MNSQNCVSEVPPANRAGPSDRAGFTLVFDRRNRSPPARDFRRGPEGSDGSGEQLHGDRSAVVVLPADLDETESLVEGL